MRRYETKPRTGTYEELVETKCDLCGIEAKAGNWDSSSYGINETEIEVKIKQRKGEAFPECGHGTEFMVDMCPDCFQNKLIPWLISQGAEITQRNWEW